MNQKFCKGCGETFDGSILDDYCDDCIGHQGYSYEKHCPRCGSDYLYYLGRGEYECNSCGETFSV